MKRGSIGRCEGIKASGWWRGAGGWGAPDGAGSRIEDRDRGALPSTVIRGRSADNLI